MGRCETIQRRSKWRPVFNLAVQTRVKNTQWKWPTTSNRKATNGERCPVRFYKEFVKRRPDAMKDPEAPFFLAINHKRKPENPVWYQKAPLGKNEIGICLSNA